jgi:zinc protease
MRLMWFVWPLTLLAQSPIRPTVGPIDTGRAVARRDTTLSNGVRVTMAHVGRSAKVLVRVVLSTGAEPGIACGLTEVVAHALDVGNMEGAGRRVADSVAHMGGAFAISARPERIDVSAEVLSAFAAPMVELIAGVVRAPPLEEAAQPAQLRALALALGAPGSADTTGLWVLRGALFPGGEFGSACSASDRVTAYGVADVDRYYRSRVGPRTIRVVVVGRFDERAVVRAVARDFGDWREATEAAAAPARPGAAQPGSGRAPSLIVVHRPGAKEAAIIVGAAIPGFSDSGAVAMRVADGILGANVVSRITMNIREAKGYAYSPGSVITTAPSGVAYWTEVADVGAGVTWPALREILGEIARLGAEEPDTSEVQGAQRYLLGRALVETATRSGWADEDELEMRVPGGRQAPRGGGRRVLDVTGADVRRVIGTYLAPEQLTVVIVGDTTALAAQMPAIREAASRLRSARS